VISSASDLWNVRAMCKCADKDRSVRREFNRQIDIPQNVDPKSLRSSLSKDGVLQVVMSYVHRAILYV